jgi:Ni/Co efflux regulator RcnB
MKKILIAAAAVSMLAVAAPAIAQDYRHGDGRYEQRRDNRGDSRYDRRDDRGWQSNRYERQINQEQREFRNRLYAGMRSGRLSEREAGRFRQGLAQNEQLEARYLRGGLSRAEYRELSSRLDRLGTLMAYDANDRNNYRG